MTEFWTEHDIHELKQDAWGLRKATGTKLGHCYEFCAQERGFKTYAAFRYACVARAPKVPQPPKQAS